MLFLVSLFLLVPVIIWAGYTTNVYLTNPHEAYRPSHEPRIQQLSHYASSVLHCCHLMNRRLNTGASRTAARLYLGKSCVNIISAVTHLPSLPVFKTHWSLSPVKYGVTLNVGSGKIIRLTEMNNWCVCRNTRVAFLSLLLSLKKWVW